MYYENFFFHFNFFLKSNHEQLLLTFLLHQIVSRILYLQIYEFFQQKGPLLSIYINSTKLRTNTQTQFIEKFVVTENSWNNLMNSILTHQEKKPPVKTWFHNKSSLFFIDCPIEKEGYQLIMGQCLFFEKTNMNFGTAQDNCQEKFLPYSGKLFEPSTIEIYQAVHNASKDNVIY